MILYFSKVLFHEKQHILNFHFKNISRVLIFLEYMFHITVIFMEYIKTKTNVCLCKHQCTLQDTFALNQLKEPQSPLWEISDVSDVLGWNSSLEKINIPLSLCGCRQRACASMSRSESVKCFFY